MEHMRTGVSTCGNFLASRCCSRVPSCVAGSADKRGDMEKGVFLPRRAVRPKYGIAVDGWLTKPGNWDGEVNKASHMASYKASVVYPRSSRDSMGKACVSFRSLSPSKSLFCAPILGHASRFPLSTKPLLSPPLCANKASRQCFLSLKSTQAAKELAARKNNAVQMQMLSYRVMNENDRSRRVLRLTSPLRSLHQPLCALPNQTK